MRRNLAGMLLGAFFANSVSVSAQDASMSEIADDVYHYWAMGYSSMIVVGDDAVLVVDTALTPRAVGMKAYSIFDG